MPHLPTERKAKAEQLAEQIRARNAHKNRLIEALINAGCSPMALARKNTSTDFLEEKARELGVEVR